VNLLLLSMVVTLVLGPASIAAASPTEVPPLPVFGGFVGAPPQITAASWILYDDTFGEVLAEHNSDVPRPMASTTKIMTAIVALENGDLDQSIRVTQQAVDVGEAEVGLVAGEALTLRQLLTAMLVRSGNDTAIAVAQGIGGTVEKFVQMMNDKAQSMGLVNTSPTRMDSTRTATTQLRKTCSPWLASRWRIRSSRRRCELRR
jgi:D-alanyl-D-alanine carboxypeptidase